MWFLLLIGHLVLSNALVFVYTLMRFIDFNFYYCYNGFVWHLGNIRFLEFEFSAPIVREDIGCFLVNNT